jgi:hypothetical protein
LVGPGNAPHYLSPWALTSTPAVTGTPGQLSGVMGRNAESQYYPITAGPAPGGSYGLSALEYQSPVPWPLRDADHDGALACVADALGLSAPIERNYYTDDNLDWGSELSQLNQLSYSSLPSDAVCDPSSFTAQQFGDVKTQLGKEFTDVQRVKLLVTNLRSPLGVSAAAAESNFQAIVSALQSTMKPPDSNTSGDAADVEANALFVLSAIPEVGDVFALSAEAMDLAQSLANNPDGTPISDFQTQASELGTELANSIVATYEQLGQVGDVLVSDWGKLQSASQRAADSSPGGWAWSDDNPDDTAIEATALTATTQRLAYEALFPLVFNLFRIGDEGVTDARGYACHGKPYMVDHEVFPTFYPFANQPNGGQTVVIGSGPATYLYAFGKTDEQFLLVDPADRDSDGNPPQSLIDQMFSTPVGGGDPQPPLPSTLQFDFETYSTQPVITAPGLSGFCLVDGNLPSPG